MNRAAYSRHTFVDHWAFIGTAVVIGATLLTLRGLGVMP